MTRHSRELQVRIDRLQEHLIESQLQARRAEEDAQHQHSIVTQLRGQLRKAEMQIDEFQPTNAKERARIVELEVALRQVKGGSTIVCSHKIQPSSGFPLSFPALIVRGSQCDLPMPMALWAVTFLALEFYLLMFLRWVRRSRMVNTCLMVCICYRHMLSTADALNHNFCK